MILSNWHVLAGASAAAVGEGILQPGRVDGGTQVVATLTRMRLDARMDAAVATLNSVARPQPRHPRAWARSAGIDTATLGMLVVKSGRTTGITRGRGRRGQHEHVDQLRRPRRGHVHATRSASCPGRRGRRSTTRSAWAATRAASG